MNMKECNVADTVASFFKDKNLNKEDAINLLSDLRDDLEFGTVKNEYEHCKKLIDYYWE